MRFAVELLQPRLGVGNSDALLTGCPSRGQSLAVVTNLDPQSVTASGRGDRDSTWADARPDSMAERVLDDRLQDEIRDRNVEDIRIDIDLNGEPILKADPFDLEIRLE